MFEFVDQLARQFLPLTPWFTGEMADDTKAQYVAAMIMFVLATVIFGTVSVIGALFHWPMGGYTGLIGFGGFVVALACGAGASFCFDRATYESDLTEKMYFISGILCIFMGIGVAIGTIGWMGNFT